MRSAWIGLLVCLSGGCEKKDQSPRLADGDAKSLQAGKVEPAASAKSGAQHLSDPLHTPLLGLVLTDKLDVGDANAEGRHQYVIERATWLGEHTFEEPDKKIYVENGRAEKGSESFRLKVTPGQDHVLVRGYNSFSKDQKLRVSVDGKVAGEWLSPNPPSVYGESSFQIPKDLIQDKQEVTIKLEFLSASLDVHAFYYWIYAKAAVVGIKAPLKTNVAGMQLMDRVDVGDEQDEKQHGYVIDGVTYFGTNIYTWPPNGTSYLENGRANKAYESFQVKTRPGTDHLLVKAYDTLSHDQKVRVWVNGTAVGEWSTSKDKEQRYGEASFKIPARFIGSHDSSTIRLDYVAGSMNDVNTFVAWIFAAPGH